MSGNCYHENIVDDDFCYFNEYGIFSFNVVSRVPIFTYLTEDDLSKEEFSNEDVIQIIQRVRVGSSVVNISSEDEKAMQFKK